MKKTFSFYPTIVMVFSLILATSCKKEEPAQLPIVSTTPATEVTASTATSGGTITSDGGATITANGVCWGTNTNPSISDSKTVDDSNVGQFVSNLTGLNAGTTYHVRAYATNSVGTAYGADISFSTIGKIPASITQAASEVSTTGATLTGTVNPNDLPTTVSFEWGTTTNYGSVATISQNPLTGNSIINVTVIISGLTPGTTYHYRIKTVNSLGTAYGSDITFSTTGLPPSATTQAASGLSSISATLNGTVNANSLPTTVTFEYGTTTSYGNTITATQSPLTGNTNSNISASISGLLPGTSYHFRAKATNAQGTVYGNDLSFTTFSLPTVSTIAISSLSSNSAASGGNVSTDGGTAISSKGICWNTTGSPTISESKTDNGTGTGSFTASMTGLLPSTTYYVRAYATNSAGTSYGNQVVFTTLFWPPLNGLVAYYPFNGNAVDESGNGLNGVVNNAVLTADRFGRANSAYSFTDNQDITIPNTQDQNLYPISISLWYNVSEIRDNENGNLFSKYVTATWNGYKIEVRDARNVGNGDEYLNNGYGTTSWYLLNTENRVIGYYGEDPFLQ